MIMVLVGRWMCGRWAIWNGHGFCVVERRLDGGWMCMIWKARGWADIVEASVPLLQYVQVW